MLGSCICGACNSVCRDSSGREQSVLLVAFAVALSLVYQYGIAPNVGSREGEINWDKGCDYDDDEMDDKCRGNAGVYRVGLASFVFFAIATAITQSNPGWNRRYWVWKFYGFLGLAVVFIWVPNEPLFDPIFLFLARVGAFVFILMQSVILIDLAYTWNESWVAKATAADEEEFGSGDKWLKAIIAACMTLYTASLVGIVVLFMEFEDCPINNSILSFTIIFIVAITAIQLSGEEGSLLTSAVVSLFGVYLAYSALSKNPDYHCNPALGGTDATGITIGILLTLLTVLWVGWSFTPEERLTSEGIVSTSSRNLRTHSAHGNAGGQDYDVSMPFLEDAEEDDKRAKLLSSSFSDRGAHSDAESDDETLDNVWKLNLVLLLVTCFFTAFLTRWGSVEKRDSSDADDPQSGHANLWIIIVSQWFTFSLYAWTLVVPRLFPDREFS